MIAEGGENRDCVHLEVSKWERSGRGAIWPPKHELGPWRPAMAGMELLRERWDHAQDGASWSLSVLP